MYLISYESVKLRF